MLGLIPRSKSRQRHVTLYSRVVSPVTPAPPPPGRSNINIYIYAILYAKQQQQKLSRYRASGVALKARPAAYTAPTMGFKNPFAALKQGIARAGAGAYDEGAVQEAIDQDIKGNKVMVFSWTRCIGNINTIIDTLLCRPCCKAPAGSGAARWGPTAWYAGTCIYTLIYFYPV